MHHDVIELRKFYYTRALGRVVQRVLRDRLAQLWPPDQCGGMSVVGYGFAAPLLRPWLARARRVTSLMPGPQGVMAWPAGLPNCSVLAEETAWPLDTGSVDRLVLLHALETADHPHAVLSEAWRVLGPGGRMLVMHRTARGCGRGRKRRPSALAAAIRRANSRRRRGTRASSPNGPGRRFTSRPRTGASGCAARICGNAPACASARCWSPGS